MPQDKVIAISALVALCLLLIAWGVWYYYHQRKTNSETQRQISDRDLLRLLRDEPDQLLSPHQLSEKAGISLNEARTRLNSLLTYGVLLRSTSRRARFYYETREPVEEAPDLNLSPDPFLTVEDLLQIFAAHDYKVTAQQMIMATGLPLDVIKREMKYFEKQEIVQKLQRTDSSGMTTRRFFVLQDPYRSDPERFRARAGALDLELRKILVDEKLLV